ncbi:MAG: hypothetical protein RR555_02765 [Bacteroidales bacterium]
MKQLKKRLILSSAIIILAIIGVSSCVHTEKLSKAENKPVNRQNETYTFIGSSSFDDKNEVMQKDFDRDIIKQML